MASKFGGIPVDEAPPQRRSRFGGIPVEDFGNVQADFRTTEALAQAQQAPIRDLAPAQARTPPLGDKVAAVGREAGRSLGLGARGLIRGVYDLSGALGGDFVGQVESKITGRPAVSSRQSADYLADKIGLPSPETSTERVSSDVTGALVGGATPVGIGRLLAARAPGVAASVGRVMASQPGTQVASAAAGAGAAGATREAGGTTGQQTITSLAGGLTPSFGRAATVEATRRAVRGGEAGRQNVAQTVNDFARLGATPSVGQATQSGFARGIESLLAASPASSSRIAGFAEDQAAKIGGGLGKVADSMAPNASAERAGRAIDRGVDTFASNVGATRQALYWQADRFIPPTSGTPMASTVRVLSELTTPNPGAAATTGRLVNPKMRQMLDDLQTDLQANNGQIPYESLRRIRTQIGEQMNDYSMTQDTPAKQLSALYGALSRDMEEVARTIGPAAESAAKRANTFTRVSSERLKAIQSVIDKNGGPEKVYNAAMAGTRDGGTTLRSVLQSLDKGGQKAVAAATIKRMGLATPGQQDASGEVFSAQTFLTNWSRVSPEAKRALFDRLGPKYSADIDRIARVASNIRDGSKVFANPSGTANKGAALAYYGAAPVAAGASVASGSPLPLALWAMSGISANMLARGMTSPKFVGWLARATELPISSLPQQVLILRNLAANEPELAEIAAEIEQRAEQPDG